jgi:hypothetical protein
VLSLIAGLVTLVGSALLIGSSPGVPYYAGMMNGHYYGGMMHGYYGMMNGYYGIVGGYGSASFLYVEVLGIASGVIVLLEAVMLYSGTGKPSTWGALIVAFSAISLFAAGGFFVGAILGIVGGILAITWKPGA